MFRTEKSRDLEAFMVEGEKKSFSECSSGCQSGWTLYLGQSQTTPSKNISPHEKEEEEEEEDLSMLSDASSGPPNNKHDYDYYFNICYSSTGNRAKRKRTVKEMYNKHNIDEELNLLLEDTASCSPVLCLSKSTSSVTSSNKLTMEDDSFEVSGGFSANHFKV